MAFGRLNPEQIQSCAGGKCTTKCPQGLVLNCFLCFFETDLLPSLMDVD